MVDNSGDRGIDEDRLADKISLQVMRKLGIESDKSMKTMIKEAVEEGMNPDTDSANKVESNWIESEDCITCESCLHLAVLDIPQHLKKYKVGNFGTVNKAQSRFHWRYAMTIHQNNRLHI